MPLNINFSKIKFRLLKKNDINKLSFFFNRISDDMKKYYSPHSFTPEEAIKICNNKDIKNKKVIGIYNKEIISYCQLFFGLREWEDKRFNSIHINLKDKDVLTIAPCVLSEYQHYGIGSLMMKYIEDIGKKYHRKFILLWGGVVIENQKAVNYYKKNDFILGKRWLHPIKKVWSYDMYKKV